jgi:hypothetical protein
VFFSTCNSNCQTMIEKLSAYRCMLQCREIVFTQIRHRIAAPVNMMSMPEVNDIVMY